MPAVSSPSVCPVIIALIGLPKHNTVWLYIRSSILASQCQRIINKPGQKLTPKLLFEEKRAF